MFSKEQIKSLNNDIKLFPQVHPIEDYMHITKEGVSRMVMYDRYTFKDIELKTLKNGDFVILTVKEDIKYPARGYGFVIDMDENTVTIKVDESFIAQLHENEYNEEGIVVRNKNQIEKPLEIFFEQISKRNARGLAKVEEHHKRKEWEDKFYEILSTLKFVPAGRVLYGAGSETDVTYFNCYVMPYPKDSRGGIAEHRKQVQEIMSRGGGVGTNGSTLRPRNALARGVNGKSSGAVSWLNDIANLTNLVEQGGSRRGAQMIMLADWHPDVIEFIISKMQNTNILRYIIQNVEDKQVRDLAQDKLKFTPLSKDEREVFENYVNHYEQHNKYVNTLLDDGGRYSVNNPEFLTGANISICLTHEFMHAVENDLYYELKFPDVENYSKEEMKYYNENWQECGDVREWPLGVKIYRKIKAKELWNLINICSTYSAEPGIFFIDNANDKTNAKAYGQKVVATNPCGEQPLAPYSVCNLAAVNLAEFAKNKEVDFEELERVVKIGVRMQDNVIDATPYFLEDNTKQALGERRVGLGVMGLHDLLIKTETVYGSEEGNKLVDKIFETISVAAYEASIELATEKGSFPFLNGEIGGYEEVIENRESFANSGFMKTMPNHIREGVRKFGIRNSHLLTVAPTGSTGTMVGVSTGLEPYFAFKYFRSGRLGKFIEVNAEIVKEYLEQNPDADADNLPEWFVSAMELSPEAHADTQCIIQRWVDSSLSKTVNAPRGYTVEQVQAVYERLWRGGAKGGTVYVDGSRDSQVLSLKNEENKLEETDVRLEENNKEAVENGENIGSDVGQTCPICRKGKVIEAGGCHTCDNCNAQLKCGL